MAESAFSRSKALLGVETMLKLKAARVLLVGVGGVGGWCAEALVRTGIGHLTIVDDDRVAVSNLNRQCPATLATLGALKVEAMRERLLAINSECVIEAIPLRIPESTTCFPVDVRQFNVVVDAIDSVKSKAAMILAASDAKVPVVSSMGAAMRIDPTAVVATRFEKVNGDGLARALRRQFKRMQRFPDAFTAVWSRESPRLADVRGSLMTVTSTFGMILASQTLSMLK